MATKFGRFHLTLFFCGCRAHCTRIPTQHAYMMYHTQQSIFPHLSIMNSSHSAFTERARVLLCDTKSLHSSFLNWSLTLNFPCACP